MGALPSIETQMQLAQANIQKLMWANAKQLIKEQKENPNSLLCADESESSSVDAYVRQRFSGLD